MTPVIAAELPPVDACPSCFPGDNPACLPLAHLDLTDGTIAAYWHPPCGTAWATWFNALGWPVDRSVAPPVRRPSGPVLPGRGRVNARPSATRTNPGDPT